MAIEEIGVAENDWLWKMSHKLKYKTKQLDAAGREQEVSTEVNDKTVITAVTVYCNCCLVISAADLLLYS